MDGKFPGIALIPVDRQGKNQIYCIPGINADFGPAEIVAAEPLFLSVGKPAFMILALEIPADAIRESIRMANLHGMKVVLDPGGVDESGVEQWRRLDGVFLMKPNEFEAEILTGVPIEGFDSAERAAALLRDQGAEYVMITHGACGAYIFGQGISKHIPVPSVTDTGIRDETGCGDQVTATLTACLAEGLPVEEAAVIAVRAGTLQFHRKGILPVRPADLL